MPRSRFASTFASTLAALTPAVVVATATAGEPRFDILGLAPEANYSNVFAVSGDGPFAAGTSGGSNAYIKGFWWSASQGFQVIDALGLGPRNNLSGLSFDGSIAAGSHATRDDGMDRRAFTLTRNGTLIHLPVVFGYSRDTGSVHISASGLVVAGTCLGSGTSGQAYRWTATTGARGLGFARSGDNRTDATAISRDGTTVVGESGAATVTGFVWTVASGIRELVGVGVDTQATGVNSDGSVIVGFARNTTTAAYRPMRWNAQRIPEDLGLPPGFTFGFARAVSDDGTVIVGEVNVDGNTSSGRACVWTPTGPILASDYLLAHGVTIPAGWTLRKCNAVSGDGRTFGGGTSGPSASRGFVATIGTFCPADFNRDGGIDGGDVESFFRSWESGTTDADVNEDGGVDGVDVEVFFRSWEAGGC